MLTASDLIHLPYTPDLTEAGIAYVCRSLALARAGLGKPTFNRLRRMVGGTAVELAFRRYLHEQSIPFKVSGNQPFTDPDRYDISLAGRRCEVTSYLFSRRGQVLLLHRDPSRLLQVPALIPSDEFAAEVRRPDDIFLFAFLLGLEAASRQDEKKARLAG